MKGWEADQHKQKKMKQIVLFILLNTKSNPKFENTFFFQHWIIIHTNVRRIKKNENCLNKNFKILTYGDWLLIPIYYMNFLYILFILVHDWNGSWAPQPLRSRRCCVLIIQIFFSSDCFWINLFRFILTIQ